ncbi:hypothetical protein GCM10009721_38000 [Terrabacter tumescens]|uniref:Uncharacterized protein n=1 Tax=Terrabacter tumescens TaxID=60443 RepID=A0ABQ2IHE2_9MICO|nr:hypothetical protein [Terrabacter tumescens]GGN06731.1 hypothetical protein GCM10009721_38000 [Terrabacter tumescens]
MTAGPTGHPDRIEQVAPVEQVEPVESVESADQVEPLGSGLMEGSGRKGRDARLGLVIAGIAGAALLVGGLIALVITMAG